jgi:hypothetical protein
LVIEMSEGVIADRQAPPCDVALFVVPSRMLSAQDSVRFLQGSRCCAA